MRKLFLALAILPIMGIWWLSTAATPTHAQTPTTVGCANVDITDGANRYGNNTIHFTGVYFSVPNDIEVTDVSMALFRQAGGLANNSSRWTIYETNGVPTGLGANQPTIATTTPLPLWESGVIAKTDLPTYSSFTAAQRGDPTNWYSESVTDLTLEADKTYAFVSWATGDQSTSFAQQIAFGMNDAGACGIENVLITGSGQVYTAADDIITADISAGAFGCPFTDFTFGCDPDSTGNMSMGFQIYGNEIFNPEVGGIDGWWPNFLEGLGQNTPFGAFMISVLIAMAFTAMMLALKIHWLFALGVPAILTVAFTLANVIDPGLFLAGVAVLLAAGILAIFGVVMRGEGSDNG